jgi:hypothetical protein
VRGIGETLIRQGQDSKNDEYDAENSHT